MRRDPWPFRGGFEFRDAALIAALALLLIYLSGCGYYPECGAYAHDGTTEDGPMCESRLVRQLTIDPAFSPSQVEAIVAAGDSWGTSTGGRVALSWVVGTPADVRAVADLPGNAVGHQWSSTGEILLDVALPAERLQVVAAHELGHSFGLGHVADAAQGMYTNPLYGVTPADVEHFERLHAAH